MSMSGPNLTERPPAAIANGRLWRMVRGYLGACFVASWGLAIGLIIEDMIVGQKFSGHISDIGIVVGGFFIVILISAAPFATAAILASESFRLRGIGPFLLAGGLIALLIEGGAHIILRVKTGPGQGGMFLLAAFVGALAGTTYWVLAVRGTRPPDVRPAEAKAE